MNRFSPVFLDFIVIPDDLAKYQPFQERLTERDVVLDTDGDKVLVLRGRFAGADFSLESIVAAEEQQLGRFIFPAVMLNGATIKGATTLYDISPPPDAFANRPAGTYVVLRFPNENLGFLVKTFVFE